MYRDDKTKPTEKLPTFEGVGEITKKIIDNLAERKSRKGVPEFRIGLDAIDKGIFGFHRAHLTTIAARPGQGKTSLCIQAAYKLAELGKKVAFISLEMTRETLIERMFCNMYELPSWDLITGLFDDSVYKKLSEFISIMDKKPLVVLDDYCFTEEELYKLVEHFEFVPDVLILDHIQEVKRDSKNKLTQWETLTEYLRTLKSLALKHKICVIAISQINRQGDSKPSLTTLKGTGGIEEMSDEVFLISEKDEIGIDGSNYIINLAKNRFGPIGSFDCYFDKKIHKFKNV